MNLRELINRLEELSNNGKNDNMIVSCQDPFDPNTEGEPVKNVWIERYVSPNDEYDYIQITVV